MCKNFLENFYGVLFTPDKTLEELKTIPCIKQGIAIVTFVSMLNYFIQFNFFDLNASIEIILSLIFLAVSGLISWVFFAWFFELTAAIFNKSGKMKEFLTLSAFALIPWLFLAPLKLIKTAGAFGSFTGIILSLLVWLWTVILIAKAVMKTYELSFNKVALFLILPFIGGIISFNWIVGFFITLGVILKVS